MSTLRLFFVTFILFGLLSYFLYHTIYGNRGLISESKSRKQVEDKLENLEDLRAQRLEIEHKVKLLRSGSLDKDMLEEEARRVLGVAKGDEEVVIKEKNNQ